MPYQAIDLVGGEYHGRVYTGWAGEGVFPVRFIEQDALSTDFNPDMDVAQTTTIKRPTNYSVRHVHVQGWLFTFAAPADMPDQEAFRYLFPHGGRPCP